MNKGERNDKFFQNILEDIKTLWYYRNNFKRDFDKKSKIYKILREEMAAENFQFYIFEN